MANPTLEIQHGEKVCRYFDSKFNRLQDYFKRAGYTQRETPDGNRTIVTFEKPNSVKVFYKRNTVG